MKPFMLTNITTYLKGIRGSRGFGIHSPFAFEFALNVLQDRCSYYAYEHLEQLHAQRGHHSQRPHLWLMKLLFRISARLDLKRVHVIGNLDPLLVSALTMASSSATLADNNIQALTVVAKNCPLTASEIVDNVVETVATGGSAIIFNHRPSIAAIRQRIDHGTIFNNATGNITVIVGQQHLPLQKFTVRFS